MKSTLKVCVMAMVVPAVLQSQAKTGEELLLDVVRTGISCTQEDDLTHCRYRVGRDLEFELSGVGDTAGGPSLTVERATPDGDYKLLIGIGSPCIGIMEGIETFIRRRTAGAPGPLARVMVSSVTGRVYLDARSCLSAR